MFIIGRLALVSLPAAVAAITGGLVLLQRTASKAEGAPAEAQAGALSAADAGSRAVVGVEQLGQSLTLLRTQEQADVKARVSAYEANLTATEKACQEAASANKKLGAEIQSIEKAIASLRKEATEIFVDTEKLRTDVRAAQANIILAREFTGWVINKSKEALDAAPELEVLRKIAEEDADRRSAQERLKRLEYVRSRGVKATLLQFQQSLEELTLRKVAAKNAGERTDAKDTPQDLSAMLKSMSALLDVIANEQQASAKAVFDVYEKAGEVEASRLSALLEVGEQLNVTRAADRKVYSRLTVAVINLKETNSNLRTGHNVLLAFMKRRIVGEPAISVETSASPSEVVEPAQAPLQAFVKNMKDKIQSVAKTVR